MKFVPLSLPIKDTKVNKWYVISKDVGWLLKTNGSIGELTKTDANECYFTSESDAHIASAVFYAFFNKEYPYMVEWAISVDTNELEEEMAAAIEQELMDFI
jgi:hypothetical protein